MRVMMDEGAFLPTRAHEDDAGYDLYSPVTAAIIGGASVRIDTGVHIEIPKGFAGFIKSRSGMNINRNLACEGVIDSGYTGSIVVKLRNLDAGLWGVPQTIERGDRIAQLVIVPVETPELEVVQSLQETERGDKGFGSSGR